MKTDKDTILIVDDYPENLEILTGILQDYRVIAAKDGKKALEIIKDDSPGPDLILLDIMMPELDGFELAKKLKNIPEYSEIPIIFVTARTDISSLLKGFEFGAKDYITKPIEPNEVMARVKAHLDTVHQKKLLKSVNHTLEEYLTEQKKQLNKSLGELENSQKGAKAAAKFKNEFLSRMSHEIRTPLNAIMNLSAIVVDEFKHKVDDDFQEIIESISGAGDRIIRTIDLILNYADVFSGDFSTNKHEINITDLFIEVCSIYREKALEKHLNFTYDDGVKDYFVEADDYTIKQVFSHLIQNAIIYTEMGSVNIHLKEKNGTLVFECQDTGIGISDKYLSNLFEPFTQEDEGYTRKYEGNGLGLALSKKYCEVNSLDLLVNSQKGIGSTFSVVFNNYH